VEDVAQYRESVDAFYQQHPEVFPEGFAQGYKLHDKQASKKLPGLTIRRVKLRNGQVYELVPSFVLPYRSGTTDEVSKGLLLRHWGVPYEVIGRNAMYWQRQEESLGRVSLVGSVGKRGICRLI
jgi:hypothetical protein